MTHATTAFNVEKIRKDFPNLHIRVNGKPLVYFDNAATTFKPQSVIDTIKGHYTSGTSNVHRGVHTLSEQATAEYESTREKVRAFLNAKKSLEIIFTGGTTDSINLVAHSFARPNLKKGDEIIISEMEHHSNIVPWQILREETGCVLKIIPMDDAGELILNDYEKMLSEKTKLVSIVYVSNSLGTVNPVKEMIALAHKKNIPVCVDAAQAVSHAAIDVQALDCDFLAFSSHKLFGPTGVGVLYAKERLLENMPPYRGGGDMIASVTFAKTTYNMLPYKFEAGTPNIADVIGLGAAIDYVQHVGLKAMAQQKADLLHYATKKINDINGVRIIGTAKNKTSIVSFYHPQVHAHDLGTLVDEEGVAIRTGHHCTQPVMQHFGIPATARASMAFYNTKEEVDVMAAAVKHALEVFHEL